MLIGYARVSTTGQSLDAQLDRLRASGVHDDQLFHEIASGTKTDRKELEQAIRSCRPGDVFVVVKLDRFGRSLKDLLANLEQLRAKEVAFRSLTEGIDTTTAVGKMLYSMLGAFAEFERDLIVERTKAGLAASRARGRRGGRKPANATALRDALALYDNGGIKLQDIASRTGISRSVLYRAIDKRKAAGAA